MSMRRSILIYAALLCTSVAALLSGCHTGMPAETADHLIGEEYPTPANTGQALSHTLRTR